MKNKIIYIFLFLFSIGAKAQYNIPDAPNPIKYVNDYSGTLSFSEINSIENGLQYFYTETGVTISLVLIENLNYNSIEDISYQWFNTWGIGGENNQGVLILFAKEDKGIRFEVGYELEETLTDNLSKRIQVETMIPYFKDEEYYEAFVAGLKDIFSLWTDSEINFAEPARFKLFIPIPTIYDPENILPEEHLSVLTTLCTEATEKCDVPVYIFVFNDFSKYGFNNTQYDEFFKLVDKEYGDGIYETNKNFSPFLLLTYCTGNTQSSNKIKINGVNRYQFDWYDDEDEVYKHDINSIMKIASKINEAKEPYTVISTLINGHADTIQKVNNIAFWSMFWMYIFIVGPILLLAALGIYWGAKSKGGSSGSGSSGGYGSSSSSSYGGRSSSGGYSGNSYGSGSSGGGGASSSW